MNVVAENHADTLRLRGALSRDGLVAAVIGEGLRANLERDHAELPEALLALLRSLDNGKPDRAAIT